MHLPKGLPSPKAWHMEVPWRGLDGTLPCGLPQFSGSVGTSIRPGRVPMADTCAKLSETNNRETVRSSAYIRLL